MWQLLIKGGEVIDPAQGLDGQRDVAILEGKIEDLASNLPPSEAKKVINAKGKIVIPGMIDLHMHLDSILFPGGLDPDSVGVLSGVTTVCDAGTTGAANFYRFKGLASSQHVTDVFCFLNMGYEPHGIDPEIKTLHDIVPDAVLKVSRENRDLVKGFKLRVTGVLVQEVGLEAVRIAKQISTEANLPLMVHIGIPPPEAIDLDVAEAYIRKLLALLDRGDILSHIFTPHPGGVIKPNGSVLPELLECVKKGVILDVAHGGRNFTFASAKKGLEKGILPTTLSTDISHYTFPGGPIFGLLATMSKFLALGLSLYQVVEMTTINPARVLREEQRRGSLKIGMPADIAILELTRGEFLFHDKKDGDTLKGGVLLIPTLVLKSGVEITPQSSFY